VGNVSSSRNGVGQVLLCIKTAKLAGSGQGVAVAKEWQWPRIGSSQGVAVAKEWQWSRSAQLSMSGMKVLEPLITYAFWLENHY